MKERPILFSSPMVKAILAGEKTQTRRIIKPQPDEDGLVRKGYNFPAPMGLIKGLWEDPSEKLYKPPYGIEEDRLWVRETWRTYESLNLCKPSDIEEGAGVEYQAGGSNVWHADKLHGMGKWRPSIYMPRWASRIILEIENVRVERLQDISEKDIRAEGFHGAPADADLPRDWRDLWDSINGDGSWNSNPWVWVVEFRKEEGGNL